MTKKDFELIARAMRQIRENPTIPTFEQTCATLADALATTNPKFDRARFLAAAGVLPAKSSEAAGGVQS